MKKEILVRKGVKHRHTMMFFAAVFALVPVILLAMIPQPLLALVGGIPFLAFLPVVFYYHTWQIRFTPQGIETSVFGNKKQYSYTQIQKVEKAHYTSERDVVIRIVLTDGKTIRFRQDDENAPKAEKELQKHCSIKTIS